MMGTHLDLDDVAAQSPLALRELQELRAANDRLRATLAESCDEHRSQIYDSGPGGGCILLADAVAAERERLLSELRRMHDEQADRPVWHNYYLYAANVLAGKILPEGTAPSTSPLVTLAQAEAMVDAVRERWAADRDMLRDALAALVDVAGTLPDVLAGKLWHRLEDARQALAQAGGPSAPGPAP